MVELVNDLIRRAYAARASDVHFEPLGNGVRGATAALGVRFRVDGLLYDIEELPAAVTPNVLSRLKIMAGLPSYRNEIPLEGSVLGDSDELPCGIRVATVSTIRVPRSPVMRIKAILHEMLCPLNRRIPAVPPHTSRYLLPSP